MALQLSENSSLLGEADTISERVRFDDNVSFIDADSEYVTSENKSSKSENRPSDDTRKYSDSSILADINKKLASNENYSYDNVAPINDDIINSSQRGIKVMNDILLHIDTRCRVFFRIFHFG